MMSRAGRSFNATAHAKDPKKDRIYLKSGII